MRFGYLILCVLVCKYSYGQITIEGKVLDLNTKNALKGAEVVLLNKVVENSKDSVEFFWPKIYSSDGLLMTKPSTTEKVGKRTYTDERGYFQFKDVDTPFTIVASYQVIRSNFSILVYNEDGRHLDSAERIEKEVHGIYYIKASCPFDLTANSELCPNCKKKDMLQPIIYGLPSVDINGNLLARDKNGKVIDDYYPGGCSPDPWCNPTKHCKRCNLDF